MNVATVFPLLNPTDPATLFPPESFTVNDTVLGVTACENVADGAADTATPVAPEPGVTLVTAGGTSGSPHSTATKPARCPPRWSPTP